MRIMQEFKAEDKQPIVFSSTIANIAYCDNTSPACANCVRYGLGLAASLLDSCITKPMTVCLFEDPVSRRELPRNYVETLEHRIAFLEANALFGPPPSIAHPSNEFAIGDETSAAQQYDLVDDNEPEDLQDLASKVGTLSLNAAGAESQYLGSSSIFAFARLIKPMLNQISISQQVRSAASKQERISPETCQLPEPALASVLSNAYFSNVHTQYPFLYEPDFRRWESSIVLSHAGNEEMLDDNFNPATFFFLNMVCSTHGPKLSLLSMLGVCDRCPLDPTDRVHG